MDPRSVGVAVAAVSGGALLGVGVYTVLDRLTGTGVVRRPYWNFGPAIVGGVVDGWGSPRSGGRLHEGIDIPAPEWSPVWAVGAGTVVYATNTIDELAGRFVVIEHEHGLASYYVHLNRALVAQGTRVKRGQVIGRSGNTGLSEGPHLHLGFRIPPENLGYYERLFGRPTTGYGRSTGRRVAVPAEPLVPITETYRDRVVAAATQHNIPIYAA